MLKPRRGIVHVTRCPRELVLKVIRRMLSCRGKNPNSVGSRSPLKLDRIAGYARDRTGTLRSLRWWSSETPLHRRLWPSPIDCSLTSMDTSSHIRRPSLKKQCSPMPIYRANRGLASQVPLTRGGSSPDYHVEVSPGRIQRRAGNLIFKRCRRFRYPAWHPALGPAPRT
jgi:hypothetical protein